MLRTWEIRVKIIPAFMGEFSKDIPDSYFDFVFSISVLEHIPAGQNLFDCFADLARILRPGGECLHAIDLYLGDEPSLRSKSCIQAWLSIDKQPNVSLELLEAPAIRPDAIFRSCHATNPDGVMHEWNVMAPAMREVRLECQSVSVKAIWRKKIVVQ